MEQPLERMQARIEELTEEVSALRKRIDGLEARLASPDRAASPGVPDAVTAAAGTEAPAFPVAVTKLPALIIALIGRTLVVLGGAYLLRAITEADLVPPLVGPPAGLLYAAWWMVQADRVAATGARLSAVFHGFAGAMIAFPLVWETTVRFELLSGSVAAGALLLFFALGLAVATRRNLWEIAWSITLLTVATILSLLIGTHDFLPPTIALLLAATLVEVFAMRDLWLGLRWPIAIGLDLAVLMLVSAALRPEGPGEGYAPLPVAAVIAVNLALPLLYLASIATRTLLRERSVTPFGMVQTGAALLIGFGSAVRVITFHEASPIAVGVFALVLGAGCYGTALTVIDRRTGSARNFYSYTSLACLLVLAGSYLVLPGIALALGWCTLAFAAAVLGRRFDRMTLKFHAAVYVTAAAFVSGLMGSTSDALMTDPAEPWQPFTSIGHAALLVAAACYGMLFKSDTPQALSWATRLPQVLLGALIVWAVAGIGSDWLYRGLSAASASAATAPFVAASRTVVIAMLAIVLAWVGRRWSLQEATWLAYPLLIGGGVKLIWEDIPYQQPLPLFIAFACYGGALLIAPRLIRKES